HFFQFNFKTRMRAEKELEKMSNQAEAALRKRLGASPSLESRRRIVKLLDLADKWWINSQMMRAIEVLERSGAPEARQLLQQLLDIGDDGRRADEVGAALRRLNRESRR